MFITGPDVVRTVTGEDVTLEELGGAMSHATKSGRRHVRRGGREGVPRGRALSPVLPARRTTSRSRRTFESGDDPERLCPGLIDMMPDSPNKPYDMKKVITTVVDDGEFFEYFPHWAGSIVCGFARLDGHPVGIVGNQPMVLAGVLDIDSSEKAARFVRTCDAFNIPLVTFVDVPGFLPGVDQEYGGIIRHGAKLLYAYCEATVPRIQVITRKAYGGAYVVMNSKSIGADLAYAWPTRRARGHGAPGRGRDPLPARAAAGRRSRRSPGRARRRVHRAQYANPYSAAERGLRRRRHRSRGDPGEADRRVPHAAHEARGAAAAQAREHAVVTAPEVADVRPTPTDEEMAAIVAAIAMTWPQPAPVVERSVPSTPAWRFSGRWWAPSGRGPS